jgi:hypothetical protein
MKQNNSIKYIWTIAYSHVIAYFLAGVFGFYIINYKELYSTDSLSLLMRPVTDPVVALGPALQIIRGIIIALILFPMQKVFFEEKHGLKKLALIILGFSLLSTIGPTFGSFDGYIYTIIPAMYQILGYPEAIIYIVLFIGLIWISNKYKTKKIITVLSIIMTGIIILMGIMGYMLA